MGSTFLLQHKLKNTVSTLSMMVLLTIRRQLPSVIVTPVTALRYVCTFQKWFQLVTRDVSMHSDVCSLERLPPAKRFVSWDLTMFLERRQNFGLRIFNVL